MALAPLSLPVQSSPARYGGGVRMINCYPERAGAEGKVEFPLFATDGLPLFSTLFGGGETRGMIVVESLLYVVSGRSVFQVDATGAATNIGGFSGDGAVFMASNQKTPSPQIAMVADGKRAIIEGGTVSPITDPDLQPPNSVAFINQYFVHTIASGRFQWSSLSEGTEYDPLDFATAEYGPDGLNRAFVRRGELLLFGENTIEPWYTPATGSSTFARSGSVIEHGCLNGATVVMLEETPVFVADDETVRVLEGYTARRISDHAVERSIRDTAVQGNLKAFAYAKDGHSFYVLSGDDFTWAYDATTGFWHERRSYGLNRWRAQNYAKLGGKHIVGDYASGLLYQIDDATFAENGADLVMRLDVPAHAFSRKVQCNELRIDTIPGQGLNTTDAHNLDPKVMVQISKDGGRSFTSERQISTGAIGQYSRQVRANRLGSSNEDGFVFQISMSAAVAKGIAAVSADLQVLSN